MNYGMLFNYNLDVYLLDFLSVKDMCNYAILNKSSLNNFRNSKYYKEISIYKNKYKTLILENICELGCINLLKNI